MHNQLEEDILKSIRESTGVCDSDFCEFEYFSPLFGKIVWICIELDQAIDLGISERQLKLIDGFLSLQASSLNEVKKSLFEHWEDGNDYWDTDISFESYDEAYEVSVLNCLFIMTKDHIWGEESSQIRFTVPWDKEHGAGVFVTKGSISGFGDL